MVAWPTKVPAVKVGAQNEPDEVIVAPTKPVVDAMLHMPPVVSSLNKVQVPTHRFGLPKIGPGKGFTVTG